MRKIFSLITVFMLLIIISVAQTRPITGKVTDESGQPIPGASVVIRGAGTGASADAAGNFRINAKTGDVLVISAVGIPEREFTVTTASSLAISLTRQSQSLNEVVVTALGIRRTRNQVPYAAQTVSGEEVAKTRTSNFVNNLSGKVSGLEIRQANTLGGSTNVVLRGNKSIASSNQALFVVDGVPYANANTNSNGTGRGDPNRSQVTGRGGYDYGSSATDINPDDIASITVLKGAAASALYGSQGANGVILITTKKGARGLGITVNSGITLGTVDKSTFPKYQKSYGGGYVPVSTYEDPTGYFLYRDIDGNGTKDLVAPMHEDASYGAAFDPNLSVFQWDAFDAFSPNFGKPRPWMAASNDPTTFFQHSLSSNQSIFIDGGSDRGTFKLGYTRNDDRGILPNSKITKNLINFGGTYNLTDKLTAGATVNFSNIEGLGRYGTGYSSENLMTNFREWWQVNVDVKQLKDAYFRNKKNVTWNWTDPSDLSAIYWDNPYFTRYENFETDGRDRYFGNVNLNYKVTNFLNVLGRISLDNSNELQEERHAIGSTTNDNPPFYSRFNRSYTESNFDLLINFDKNITPDFNLKALIGSNIRKQRTQSIFAITNGGLVIDRLYALTNSVSSPTAPIETDLRRQVNGYFGGLTLSWKDMLTLDGTLRNDHSSTLPKGKNSYWYPSISTGFVFSKLLPGAEWMTYGKLRGNYAEVGNDAPIYSTGQTYFVEAPFGSVSQYSVSSTSNNPNLLPEKTKSSEVGLEMSFLKSRVGFDVTYYDAKSVNQIIPVSVSTATGYSFKYVNSGTVRNKGIELSLYATPVKTRDFNWNVNVNWTRNRSKVEELYTDASGNVTDNIVLGNMAGGVSINATLGQPYGTIRGRDFIYTNGEKTVNASGRYLRTTTSNEIIGNPNPNWIGGINNSFRYKNLNLSFLVDTRQGGDVFSLDMYYGLATGLYPETVAANDKGVPSRTPMANGGGFINPGVTADGKPNTTRIENGWGELGYYRLPAKAFVYDATFVKLREVVLSYSLPQSIIQKTKVFKGIDLSLIGRNLWIIHKNLPYADPEETVSSGNLQGYQVGAYPTTRTFSFNLKLRL